MKRITGVERKARALLKAGRLAKGLCGQALLVTLRPLIDANVLGWLRSGTGEALIVYEPESLRQFIEQLFPLADAGDGDARVQGVAAYRDSKAIGAGSLEIVSIRAWSDDVLRHAGEPTAAGTLTQAHGVFSFFLSDVTGYTLHGCCALVENPTVFSSFERLGLQAGVAIYGRGRISDHLLEWLSRSEHVDLQVLHCPDYDPVGLNEFMRLRKRLGSRVRLHLPENLESLFVTFAKPALLHPAQSQAMLQNLREVDDESVRAVVALIDRHGAGLEQESLLIQSTRDQTQ